MFSVVATRLGNDKEIKASLSPYKAMDKYLVAIQLRNKDIFVFPPCKNTGQMHVA